MSSETTANTTTQHSQYPIRTIVPELTVLNRHVKHLQSQINAHQVTTEHTQIKQNRKHAIYDYKHWILSLIEPDADTIERHRINNMWYYCLYFGSESFHIPEQKLHPSVPVYTERELPHHSTTIIHYPETRINHAITTLKTVFERSINEFLPQTSVYSPTGDVYPTTWNSADSKHP